MEQTDASSAKVTFTVGRIASFQCAPGKTQQFKWDDKTAGLGIRLTPRGKPAYVFQSTFQGQTLRITIGATETWTIADARLKARSLQATIDEGRDPRIVRKEMSERDIAQRKADREVALTVGEAWSDYLANGKPVKKEKWKPGYVDDLREMAAKVGKRRSEAKA